jgi:hypothetical protein
MLHEENMKTLSRVFAEGESESNRHKFIVYFLCDDEDQNVHVEEVEELDLSNVTQHLDSGGSVFITHRREPEIYTTFYAEEELADNRPLR